MFEDIAHRYDLLNDLLSLGLHRVWKRQSLAWLNPLPGQLFVDLCCGTGDLALLLAAKLRPGGQVLGIDTAAAPLAIARQRSSLQPWLPVQWRQGDALATRLPNGWADGAAMAYGLRNLTDPGSGLGELRRVLRPGGRAAVLDFNRPNGKVAAIQTAYLRRLVVPMASWFALHRHYAYLEASLERFPDAETQETLARSAGFAHAHHRTLAGGLMGLLELIA